jgi:hypothetical protein
MIFSHGADQPEPPDPSDGSGDRENIRNERSHLKIVK